MTIEMAMAMNPNLSSKDFVELVELRSQAREKSVRQILDAVDAAETPQEANLIFECLIPIHCAFWL